MSDASRPYPRALWPIVFLVIAIVIIQEGGNRKGTRER
jgi:hypothetical protein